MSALIDLPPELQTFLGRTPPQTLLIRGPPGTGKTTLALSVLRTFPGARTLVSSRVGATELRSEFPWISNGSEIQVVDDSERTGDLAQTAKVLDRLGEVLTDPSRSDALRGLWLPSPVQEAYSRSDPSRPLMVVIDSWDALIERYQGAADGGAALPDRGELERILLDQMARGPVFLVLVLERAAPSQLDYLVNGVLEASSNGHENRPERWLHVRKLRGTRIDSPSYPFTLESARFRCFAPIPPAALARAVAPEPEPDVVPGQIWPGSGDWAAAFGRLPVGRITLLERDPACPIEASSILLRPIAGHVARSGGRVVHILPPNLGASEVLRTYEPFLTREQILRQVRLQTSGGAPDLPAEFGPMVLPPPVAGAGGFEPKTPEAVRFLHTPPPPGAANLGITWTTALRTFAALRGIDYSPSTLPGIAFAFLADAPVHLIFVGPTDDPLIEGLRTMATTRIHLEPRAGRIFAWGVQPVTPSYVLTEGDRDGGRPYRLVRLV